MNIKHWLLLTGQKVVTALFKPIIQPILLELRKAKLSPRDAAIANPLAKCGSRHFSQHDEDGILLEVLRRIGATSPSAFLEFGVGNGLQNNTIILLALGWRGLWVGAEALAFQPPAGGRLAFLKQWITKETAPIIAKDGLATLGIGLQDVKVARLIWTGMMDTL
jgi:hypothetical protein